ncbi:DUF4145 domain-containing protein [Pantoea sp. PNT01]|uniref:DUF4145 domain-containing protein n=1 Tax=Pantoea sp. PNT01 TaxID=2769271 RepID=UPI001781D27F|nr:DUF4145 domain-containing protein [Pantoea sp. PNT01]MBD9551580.1 DUF4145 domain-containing protein [Pantoea sp. PNT01]
MKPKDLVLTNYNDMVTMFHQESDRGAAVLAGSYVENLLGSYLVYCMEDKSLKEKVFSSNGPLSSFSQRIEIAQAFGHIDKKTANKLDLIRKIRNHFAHHPFDASFEDSPVKDWANNLFSLMDWRDEQGLIKLSMTPRVSYLISCGYFSALTHIKMEEARP